VEGILRVLGELGVRAQEHVQHDGRRDLLQPVVPGDRDALLAARVDVHPHLRAHEGAIGGLAEEVVGVVFALGPRPAHRAEVAHLRVAVAARLGVVGAAEPPTDRVPHVKQRGWQHDPAHRILRYGSRSLLASVIRCEPADERVLSPEVDEIAGPWRCSPTGPERCSPATARLITAWRIAVGSAEIDDSAAWSFASGRVSSSSSPATAATVTASSLPGVQSRSTSPACTPTASRTVTVLAPAAAGST